MEETRNVAIILAAGRGKRMDSEKNKQFLEVCNIPIIVYTLNTFISHPLISNIVLVVSKMDVEMMKEQIVINYFKEQQSKIQLVIGGNERYDSVYNALKVLDQNTNNVLIHDGARPLVSGLSITELINSLEFSSASILAVRAKDTFKVVDNDNFVINTLERNSLFSIQTPQAFHMNVILEAYEKGIQTPQGITDDSMMVELFTKYSVKVVEGEYSNIKITTPDDLILMENILLNKNNKKL